MAMLFGNCFLRPFQKRKIIQQKNKIVVDNSSHLCYIAIVKRNHKRAGGKHQDGDKMGPITWKMRKIC